MYGGDIEHNSILFNQSSNPTIATNGGGLLIMGAPDIDPTCGAITDIDCLSPTPTAPADGTGPGLVINANLIMGNAAESGSGGGIRFHGRQWHGRDHVPTTPDTSWYSVLVTTTSSATTWPVGMAPEFSLLDALAVNIINNTIVSTTRRRRPACCSTRSALRWPAVRGHAPSPQTGRHLPGPVDDVDRFSRGPRGDPEQLEHDGEPAGDGRVPDGALPGTNATNANCRSVSYPLLYNNVIWQNRVFNISVGGWARTGEQQNVVALIRPLSQPSNRLHRRQRRRA